MNDFGVLFLIVVLIILLVINAKYNNGILFSRNSFSKTLGMSINSSSKTSTESRESRESRAARESRESRESRAARESRESRESRDVYGNSTRKKSSWFSYNQSDGEEANNDESDSDEADSDEVDSDKSSSSIFKPKIIKKKSSINQNKVYDLSIASSKGSSITCTTNNSSVLKPSKQDKDYYYLGNPEDSQLYHIFKNVYTFDEAKEECVKRNGVLADPQELANAYTSGANWCSWGWTSDGNAYLPSKTPECNKDVGLLNGKKIDPYLRLGTNCYGVPQ